MVLIPEGRYIAKAISYGVAPAQRGNKLVIMFGITVGEHKGETPNWTGYFDEDRTDQQGFTAREKTVRVAKYCGIEPYLEPKQRPQVWITIKHSTGSRVFANVTWVEPIRVRLDNQLTPEEAAAFLREMANPIAPKKEWSPEDDSDDSGAGDGPSYGSTGDDDDIGEIPF